jgi:trimethylamine--corrinoid protein Co-methyltransferase
MVKHIVRGIKVDEESLALDVIHNVGPGGNFLAEEHTLKHFREEFWFPKLINRQNYEKWMENGSTSLADRVNKKVLNILQDYQPTPLADDVLEELGEIINKADRERIPVV